MLKARKLTGLKTGAGPLKLEPLPPKEAIKFFGNKAILTADEFYALESWARSRAFTVAGVTKAEVLNDIHSAVDDALQQGTTLEDFRGKLQEIMQNRGWEGTTPWHEETIFRTNIQTAYSVGRYEQIQKVKEAFPYLQYLAIDDDRVRPEHLAMNGRIFPIDSPVWDEWTPPNGFNCRCSTRPISQAEAESRGLLDDIEMDNPSGKSVTVKDPLTDEPIEVILKPDKGFDVNPAVVPYTPDLSKLPEELRAMVKSELKKAA